MIKMTKALTENSKTIRSIDITTICPKALANNPCPYCYVQNAREVNFRAKAICTRTEYTNDILRLRRKTIDKLNRIGGLRLFAFGDYDNSEYSDKLLEQIIGDARKKGLKLKAITRVISFVYKYADKVDTINLSIDSIGHGIKLEKATELKRRFKNVFIRTIALNEQDLENWLKNEHVDVITLYHGRKRKYGDIEFRALRRKDIKDNRICSGKCIQCNLKCGRYV